MGKTVTSNRTLFIIAFCIASLSGASQMVLGAPQPVADENLKNLAIKFKDATSFYLLAQKYAVKGGDYGDYQQAIKWYLEAAKLGHTKSQLKLGTLYFKGLGTDVNHDEAAKWLKEPANSGYTAAQYMLGMIYLQGTDKIRKNEHRAFELLKKAADDFNTDALYQTGKLYYLGLGTEKNREKALKYLRLAKEQNIAAAADLIATIESQNTKSGTIASTNNQTTVSPKKSANDLLSVAAKSGDASAQFQLATAYLEGKSGLTKNRDKALHWFNKAAKNGHKDAQYLLGSFYYNGNPVKRDMEKAKHWLTMAARAGVESASVLISAINAQTKKKTKQKTRSTNDLFLASAEKGDKNAQFKVGLMYLYGEDGFTKDEEKALHWLGKAAAQDHTKAQYEVGMMHYRPGDEDNEIARALLAKAADKGHTNSQYFLAAIYTQKQQFDNAAQWLDRAFQNDHEEALEMLVELYISGKIQNADKQRVLAWLEKASLKGIRDAQYKLGEEYLDRKDVSNHQRKAFAWIEKSARNGFTQAKYKLAMLYNKGVGARKQYTKSARWFREAAKEGHMDAQYNLAELYLQGLGLPRSKSKAKKWLELAAEQGHMKAKIKLGSLTRF